MTLASVLPDLLGLAESAFGPGKGAEKQAAVIAAVSKGMLDAGIPKWVVSIVAILLQAVIPMLIAKYNADPTNTLFTKPSPV